MENKYLSFKAADFLLDADFLEWMTSGNPLLTESWESWLLANPHKRQEVEKARRLFEVLKFRKENVDAVTIDKEWEKLRESIGGQVWQLQADDDAVPKRNRQHPSFLYGWWRPGLAAAVFAFMAMAGVVYFYMIKPRESLAGLVEHTAPRGERVSVMLEDGTKVLLNAGSRIIYPKSFKPGKRELTLFGEAFFEVAPDPGSPFTVTTGSVTTEVLGTSFGITAYPDHRVDVAVVTGKVKVYDNEADDSFNEVYLSPSQMASYEDSSGIFKIRDFEQHNQLAWISGVLYFDKADFRQVRTKLENWYGVTLIVDPGLRFDDNLLLTGKYQDKPLEYILDAYRYPDRFRYQVKNDTVTIFH